MPRSFAAALALIAFVTVIVRGTIRGAQAESIVFYAWLSLIAFAIVGYIVGTIAGSLIDHAAQARVVKQLAADPTSESQPNTTS